MSASLHILEKGAVMSFIGEWIPADNPPTDDRYILLSFANFSLPEIGHYEENEDGGVYYLGDDTPALKNDLIVNAWMELPKRYEE